MAARLLRSGKRGWLLPALLAAALAPPAQAQVAGRDTLAADSVRQDTVVRKGLSPRGAMVRSFLLPGWGQVAVGSYTRGAIFFAMDGTSWYMLLRTIHRLNQARAVNHDLVVLARDSLDNLIAMDTAKARELSDPDVYAAAVAAAPGVEHARALVESRRQQRQDWVTYTLFFTLLSGVDAYVNAHLRNFPVGIDSQITSDGGVRFSATVGLPGLLGGSPRVPATAAGRAPPPLRW